MIGRMAPDMWLKILAQSPNLLADPPSHISSPQLDPEVEVIGSTCSTIHGIGLNHQGSVTDSLNLPHGCLVAILCKIGRPNNFIV